MEDRKLNETDRGSGPIDTKCRSRDESSEKWASRTRGSPLALVSVKRGFCFAGVTRVQIQN